MPQLADPNFKRSVVLMIEHSADGSMGLVLNRGSQLSLKEMAKGQKLKIAPERGDQPVFVGGPVEPHRGFVLHDSRRVDEKIEVMPGLFLSVTADALGPLLLDPTCRLRFCLGYAGWGPRQIDHELEQGTWLFTEAVPAQVLEGDADKLWSDALRGMGVEPAQLMHAGGVH